MGPTPYFSISRRVGSHFLRLILKHIDLELPQKLERAFGPATER